MAAMARREPTALRVLVIVVLWLLLGLFVTLSAGRAARARPDRRHGRFTLAPLIAADQHHRHICAPSSTACCSRRWSASAAPLLGFLFALYGSARRAGRALADHCSTPRSLLPLVSPPFTSSIAMHLLVRAARPHHLRPARLRRRRPSTASPARSRRNADLFPDRLSDAAAAARRRSIRISRRWRSASARRAGACFAP